MRNASANNPENDSDQARWRDTRTVGQGQTYVVGTIACSISSFSIFTA
jgi:hypothetical protein